MTMLVETSTGILHGPSKMTGIEAFENNNGLLKIKRSPSDEELSTTSSTPLSSPAANTTLSLSNGKRKSAFSPYKATATVLTNLQRGNTEADVQAEICLNFHERSGQGEITDEQAQQQPFIDAVDDNEFTALHWACFYGQLCSVKILVKCGANVSKAAPDMVTPLLMAAAGGHHEIVRLLLQHGADVNQMDIVGNTALMYAAAGNHPHTCNELLTHHPNIFERNENDCTAYNLAVRRNANLAQAVLENYIVSLMTT